MPALFSPAAHDVALEALFVPFDTGKLLRPADGRVLFLRARDGFRLREMAGRGWVCEQSFKPFADALVRSGLNVSPPGSEECFPMVLVLPPRQRDEARALFAQALRRVSAGGVVLAAVPNAEGAKSAEGDLASLAGPLQHLSKHKCRVFWTQPVGAQVDAGLRDAWALLDAPRLNDAGYISRPGLFAWDRVDTASALLAAQLPRDLAGDVADLGAGYGYLSTQVVTHCPAVSSIDLYEAEARALEPARQNLVRAQETCGRAVAFSVHWHDVTQGLPRRYDAIVSNPPFHQGRADLPELGRAFIDTAANALLPHGRFWLVANRHLPYEATLASRFNEVRTVVTQDGFKVIEARGVRV
ncbi:MULTISPECIES: methyltransferase [unclassified Dyella]|uniref:class I SAM-dependent methyltransferase n=1 Tax=unclassified Dyella TaxID=2634549 RepID=UPI000C829C0C|nr:MULTISPECIES: methyltransferase [unclassified Dyella]MDR3445666.1 methyltransferase [Dyella sp.]PMQ04009.1 Ribosomal RNA small subunit methyltransferase C [Dyella sp. AD56]